MRFSTLRSTLLVSTLALLATACRSSDGGASAVEASVRPGVNERFLDEELDVEQFVGVFERETREVAALRDEITAALRIRPGAAVADVGAGTGLFLEPFAEAVGENGQVYAVELSPAFCAHLERVAFERGLEQVDVVQCTERSVELPIGAADLVFVCDTYHHFEYPASVLGSIYAALRPGGRLAIVDFERIPALSSAWVLEHVRAGKERVIAEIEAAGFRFEGEVELEGLEENYLVLFSR